MSTQEHVDRLVAARLACDILGTGTIIVARTDAEAATLLDSNMDRRDHPFILGVTVPGVEALQDATDSAGARNVDSISQNWATRAKLMTFGDAVMAKIEGLRVTSYDKRRMINQWMAADPDTLSNTKARRVADSIFGQRDSVYFDWELCRVREGYYQIKAGIDYCIQRARAYAPYCDLIWMETAVPGIPDAKKFSDGVKVGDTSPRAFSSFSDTASNLSSMSSQCSLTRCWLTTSARVSTGMRQVCRMKSWRRSTTISADLGIHGSSSLLPGFIQMASS